MALPTVYTEDSLAQYMQNILGAVATALGYTAPGSYVEAINETLFDYGVAALSDIAGQESIKKLRSLARVQAWQLVVRDTAGDYDFRTGESSFNRSQVHDQATKNLEAARTEAAEYSSTYQVGVETVEHLHDPYRYIPEDERTL